MNPLQLLHGDCAELLATLPDNSVDLVLTDPPYNVSNNKSNIHRGATSRWTASTIKLDFGEWDKFSSEEEFWHMMAGFFEQSHRLLTEGGHLVVWMRTEYVGMASQIAMRLGFKERQCFYWIKPSPAPQARKVTFMSGVEVCKWFTKGETKSRFQYREGQQKNWVLACAPRGKKRFHSCQKAEEPFNILVRYLSAPGETVLDPFMGSGTTGACALAYGRKFIGIEREAEFFEKAKARLEAVPFGAALADAEAAGGRVLTIPQAAPISLFSEEDYAVPEAA